MTNTDLRISVHLGVTLPIPGVDYGMVKPVIEINGIDPNANVDEQVNLAIRQAAVVMARVDEQLEVSIIDLLSPETGVPGYRERLEEAERSISAIKKRVNDVVAKLREQNSTLVELTSGVVSSAETPAEEAPAGD